MSASAGVAWLDARRPESPPPASSTQSRLARRARVAEEPDVLIPRAEQQVRIAVAVEIAKRRRQVKRVDELERLAPAGTPAPSSCRRS